MDRLDAHKVGLRLKLEKYLSERLRYDSRWYPTQISLRAKDGMLVQFKPDTEKHSIVVNKLLEDPDIDMSKWLKIYLSSNYIYKNNNIIYYLDPVFNYWADKPLVILDYKEVNDTRFITQCIPYTVYPVLLKRLNKEQRLPYILQGYVDSNSITIKPKKDEPTLSKQEGEVSGSGNTRKRSPRKRP